MNSEQSTLSDMVNMRLCQLAREVIHTFIAQGKTPCVEDVAGGLVKVVWPIRHEIDGHALGGALLYQGACQYAMSELEANDD